MKSTWTHIYQEDFLDLIKVVDIHPELRSLMGTQNETYVHNSKFFISANPDTWSLGIYPQHIPMNSFDINRFYALCHWLDDTYPGATILGRYGIIIDTELLEDKHAQVAAHIITTLYQPSPDNQWWKRFTALRNYTNFILGGEILTYQSSITPYYLDEKSGTVSLGSSYGQVLLGGEEEISPVYVKTVPYVTFPGAKDLLDDNEITKLDQTEDIWIDNKGINVYVPKGDSALSIARAIKKVTSIRWIPSSERYNIVPYEDKVDEVFVADVAQEMRFSAVSDVVLRPERYMRPYSSGLDYTSSTALTKGVFR